MDKTGETTKVVFFSAFFQWWQKINTETNGIYVGKATNLPGTGWEHGWLWWLGRNNVQCTSEQQLS